jgi:hypothetical protein
MYLVSGHCFPFAKAAVSLRWKVVRNVTTRFGDGKGKVAVDRSYYCCFYLGTVD